MNEKLIAGWNIALTDGELKLLADGSVLPSQIHPENLIYFFPLVGKRYADALLAANKQDKDCEDRGEVSE